ncbi:MAG: DUF6599 family protein [bacterium]
MGAERVFGTRFQPLLRKRIAVAEVAAGGAVLLALALAVWWVAAQREAYNPAERDLPYQLLADRPVEDLLYRRPRTPWLEPGAVPAGASAGRRVQLGLFPLSVLQGGWAISSRPRRFDRQTLFEKINGEADKFIRQGFEELHYLALRAPGGDELAVELFDMGSFAGALGVFSGHRTAGRKVEPQGEALYYTTPVGAVGFGGRYFFRIAGSVESEAIRRKTGQLISVFAGLAAGEGGEGGARPFGYRFFRGPMGVAAGAISYQAANVFQYDFAGDFWFGRPRPGSPARFFLHRAATAKDAARLFERIAAEHAEEFEVLRRTETGLAMRHPFLKTHFAMGVRGKLIFGVEKEPSLQAAGRTLQRLAEALLGGAAR